MYKKQWWLQHEQWPQMMPKAEPTKGNFFCQFFFLFFYYELLPIDKTFNSDVYCEQRPLLANRRDIPFHYDNARPDIFANTSEVISFWLGCFTSSSIFPAFFYFWLSSVSISTKLFESSDIQFPKNVKIHPACFFPTKNHKFFEQKIFDLTRRWQKVISQNGKYAIKNIALSFYCVSWLLEKPNKLFEQPNIFTVAFFYSSCLYYSSQMFSSITFEPR